MSENTQQTFYYWLISLKIAYEIDGVIKHREDNTFLTSLDANINLHVLNSARFMYLQDFCGHTGLPNEAIKNFVFLNLVCLGRMTDEEFQKVPQFSEESDQTPN